MPVENEFGQPVGEPVPGWTERPRPRAEPLHGRYVALVPPAEEHAGPLHAAVCGPGDRDLWTYRFDEPPADPAGTARMLVELADDLESPTWVVLPAGRGPEGLVTLTRVEPAHGQVEIASVLFARRLQRTTAATETLHLLLRHAFDTLGYRRVEWKCDALNEPSRRAATRLGLRHEGRFRQHLVVKGRNRDTDWFSVLDAEWPEVRAAHERWLDPANFDAEGRQRTALRGG